MFMCRKWQKEIKSVHMVRTNLYCGKEEGITVGWNCDASDDQKWRYYLYLGGDIRGLGARLCGDGRHGGFRPVVMLVTAVPAVTDNVLCLPGKQ